jgi:hypothetical protein
VEAPANHDGERTQRGEQNEIASLAALLDLVLAVPVFPGTNLMDFDHYPAIFEASYQWVSPPDR